MDHTNNGEQQQQKQMVDNHNNAEAIDDNIFLEDNYDNDDDIDIFMTASKRQAQLLEERRLQRKKRLRDISDNGTDNNGNDNDDGRNHSMVTNTNTNTTPATTTTIAQHSVKHPQYEDLLPPSKQQQLTKDNDTIDGKNNEDMHNNINVNDDDEFDMFSSSVSPICTNNNTAPIIDPDTNQPSTTTRKTTTTTTTVSSSRNQQQQDWDDSEGYYKAVIGETIDLDTSSSTISTSTNMMDDTSIIRVRVAGVIGKGVFSTVLKGTVISNPTSIALPITIAIKCIRHNDTMAKAAMTELQILHKLKNSPGIVPLLLPISSSSTTTSITPLEHRGHTLLVFHFMEYNLRDVLQKFGKGVGISLQAVRSYYGQLLSALTHLQKHNIIHADLKPDNILVRADFALVQIADFGSAMDMNISDNTINQPTPYLVSRFYRAPEIILGLSPLSHMIDLWSIAVTVAELYLGDVLFRGTSNNDMLYVFQQHMGPFSNRVIRQHLVQCQKYGGQNQQQLSPHFQLLPGSGNSYHFTQRTVDTVTGTPVLKVHSLVVQSDGKTPSGNKVKFPLGTPLSSKILKAKSTKDTRGMVQQFIDLLSKCLVLDPSRRIALKDALRHDFFVTTVTSSNTTHSAATSNVEK